jgi:hypothetical protein
MGMSPDGSRRDARNPPIGEVQERIRRLSPLRQQTPDEPATPPPTPATESFSRERDCSVCGDSPPRCQRARRSRAEALRAVVVVNQHHQRQPRTGRRSLMDSTRPSLADRPTRPVQETENDSIKGRRPTACRSGARRPARSDRRRHLRCDSAVGPAVTSISAARRSASSSSVHRWPRTALPGGWRSGPGLRMRRIDRFHGGA